jgi:hypothetical protein
MHHFDREGFDFAVAAELFFEGFLVADEEDSMTELLRRSYSAPDFR